MSTIDTIFADLGGPAKAGRTMGVSTEHAATMRRRGSIPVRYWHSIIEATADSAKALSLADLHQAHAEGRIGQEAAA